MLWCSVCSVVVVMGRIMGFLDLGRCWIMVFLLVDFGDFSICWGVVC